MFYADTQGSLSDNDKTTGFNEGLIDIPIECPVSFGFYHTFPFLFGHDGDFVCRAVDDVARRP